MGFFGHSTPAPPSPTAQARPPGTPTGQTAVARPSSDTIGAPPPVPDAGLAASQAAAASIAAAQKVRNKSTQTLLARTPTAGPVPNAVLQPRTLLGS